MPPFTPKDWVDAPSTSTPISAAALEDLETRVTDYTDDEIAAQTFTAADISDFDTQVRTSRLDQMAAPTAEVGMNSQQLGGLVTPVDDDHAARKKYVDDADVVLSLQKLSVSVVDAKGDILIGTADNSPDNFPAPANDNVLVADSGQTFGWKGDKIKAANVDATLKPSGSAAAGDEALRAIGSTASTAAAGNHTHTLASLGAASDAELLQSMTRPGSVSASVVLPIFVAPFALNVEEAYLVSAGAVTANNTNYYTVTIRRYRSNSAATIATETTQVTGGTSIAAWTHWPFDGGFNATNKVFQVGDICAVGIAVTGTISSLADVAVTVRYVPA